MTELQKGPAMTTPIVTEINRRLEPVAHDTFIDDLGATRRGEREPASQAAGQRQGRS
jgi:hypothetical protein